MANYWSDHSVKLAPQTTDLNTKITADADFVAVKCTKPSVSLEQEVTELDLLAGKIGAGAERIVGKKSGTISFDIPMEGFKAGYDGSDDAGSAPASGHEVVPPWLCLVGSAMGCNSSAVASATDFWRGVHLSCAASSAAGVTSATASALTVDSSTVSDKHLAGQLVVSATAASDTSPQFGFLKTKAAQVLTYAYDTGNIDNSGTATTYSSATAWSSNDQPIPMTIRWTGQETAFSYVFIGCVMESFTINGLDAGAVPTISISYRFYDYECDNTLGGLEIPSDYDRVPRIVGTSNGRALVGSAAGAMAVTCGLEGVSLAYSCEVREVPCHSKSTAVSAVQIIKPRYQLALTIPHSSTDTIYDGAGASASTGAHEWQSALQLGQKRGLAIEVGSKIGRIAAIYIPAAVLTAAPSTDTGDVLKYGLSFEAAAYDGDSTDTAETEETAPIDSSIRIGLG